MTKRPGLGQDKASAACPGTSAGGQIRNGVAGIQSGAYTQCQYHRNLTCYTVTQVPRDSLVLCIIYSNFPYQLVHILLLFYYFILDANILELR